MKRRYSNLFLSTLVFFSTSAFAQPAQQVHVFGEDDKPDHHACGVTYDRAVANVEAALRFNRFEIVSEEKTRLRAYVNINVMKISRSCVAEFSLKFYAMGYLPDPISGESAFLKVEYCNVGTLVSGDSSYLSANLNTELTAFTNVCVKTFLNRHSSS